jgi:epoxyqueuosine reductase
MLSMRADLVSDLNVFLPVVSDNSKRFCRQTSQDVCPWNVRFARDATEPALQPRADRVNPDAAELLALTEAEWRARFGKSAMTRAKRRGLARNAAVVLGNRRDPSTIPALEAAAEGDPEPIVRAHARWALEQFE